MCVCVQVLALFVCNFVPLFHLFIDDDDAAVSFASLLRTKEKQNYKEKILHMLSKLFVTHIVKQIQ